MGVKKLALPTREQRPAGERKSREERWTQLLKAAAEVFFENGYEASTLQQIADRVGLLKGSIYHYIDTKVDLLDHLLIEAQDEGFENLRATAEAGGNPVRRLAAMIQAHIDYVCRNWIRTAVYVHERPRLSDAVKTQFNTGEKAYRRLFERAIVEAQEQGMIHPEIDPKLATLCLASSLNSLYTWYRPNRGFSVAVIGQHFISVFLKGLATSEGVAALDDANGHVAGAVSAEI